MRKPVKKIIYSILGAVFIIVAICFGIVAEEPTVIPIHTNELLFTTTFDSSATLLIPAAYTNEDGTIVGEYRIAGKTYGTPTRKERISLHPTKGLIISGQWHSDYGFQQTVLVKNYKIRYYDDDKKAFRRALATVNGQLCILTS